MQFRFQLPKFDSGRRRGTRRAGFSSQRFLPSGLLLLLLLAGRVAGAEDVLQQLEKEAQQLATTPLTTQATTGAGSPDATAPLPSGLKQGTFEQALRDQFMSTYEFYQRLRPEDKAKVFASYQQDNQIGTIHDLILKLLGETP